MNHSSLPAMVKNLIYIIIDGKCEEEIQNKVYKSDEDVQKRLPKLT